jgi:cytochrome c-type biogenesis protein CcmH/NrfG
MRLVPVFMLLLLVAPIARSGATERDVPRPEVLETRLAPQAPERAKMVLAPIPMAERAQIARDVPAQEMPRRGGMLWVIGALVVAGIILAAVLA